MPLNLGLTANYGKSKTSSQSTTNSSSTSKSTSLQEVVSGDVASKQSLDSLMKLLGVNASNVLGGNPDVSGYTKSAAIADSQGLVKSIFDQYKQSDLPQIYQAQSSSGGYNSTAAQTLADNAFGQAVSKAQGAVLGNIKSYADITNTIEQTDATKTSSILGALLQSLGLQQSATKKATGSEDTVSTGTSTTRGSSSTKGFNVGGSASGSPGGGGPLG